MRPDYLVVGTGLTGATIARTLVDAGCSVIAVERRSIVGGHVYDYTHASGIRIQKFGPHYFRTSSAAIWSFVRRFAGFYRYEAKILSRIDGKYEPWPVSASYIARRFGRLEVAASSGAPRNFEAAVLAKMPRQVYELFVKEYTEKQWGVAPDLLDARLARRVTINETDDPRLTPRARYQGLPVDGYTSLVEGMLAAIPTLLDFDFLANRREIRPRRMTVFTGAIDEYYGYTLGRLKYRGQIRSTTYLPELRCYQPAAQVNEPQHAGGRHIRTIEWKHLMQSSKAESLSGTIVTQETPFSPERSDEYEYPFPDEENAVLYERYRKLASADTKTMICGRLGEYRYYDMDQAIARGRLLAHRMLHP